jgi:hypothetical protein
MEISLSQEIARKTLESVDATLFLLAIGAAVMVVCVFLADASRR